MSVLTAINQCLTAFVVWAARVRNAVTQSLFSTTQQTETNMTDPQTTDTNDAQAATQEPRNLEVVFEEYEAALSDFNGKVEQASAAKAAAIESAQRVSDLKKELDTLEGDVAQSFAPVEAFLASA